MGRADYLALGDWNARCYECGAKYKASELLKHWQGYYVCQRCWEPRHPQDFVRSVSDVQTVPWSQSSAAVYALGTAIISANGTYSLAALIGSVCTTDPSIITIDDGVIATINIDSIANFVINNYGLLSIILSAAGVTQLSPTEFSSSCGLSYINTGNGMLGALCTETGRNAIPEKGIPNCLVPNYTTP